MRSGICWRAASHGERGRPAELAAAQMFPPNAPVSPDGGPMGREIFTCGAVAAGYAGCPNEADVQHGRGRRQSDVNLRHAAGLHCGQTDRPSESVLLSGYERDPRTGQGRWCRLRRVGTRRDGSRGGQSRKRSAQQTSSLSRRKSPPARRSNRSIQDDIEVSTHHVAPWPGWRADRRVGRRAPRPPPSTTSGRCIRPFWSPAT